MLGQARHKSNGPPIHAAGTVLNNGRYRVHKKLNSKHYRVLCWSASTPNSLNHSRQTSKLTALIVVLPWCCRGGDSDCVCSRGLTHRQTCGVEGATDTPVLQAAATAAAAQHTKPSYKLPADITHDSQHQLS
jgi:hypothetical protein